MNDLNKLIKSLIPWQALKFLGLLRSVFYLGSKYYCPNCNGKFKKLIDFGKPARSNSRCPRCTSMERQRLVWLYLVREFDIKNKKYRLLHIGPSLTFLFNFKSMKNIDYYPADLNNPYAEYKEDLNSLSFKNDKFDLILCSHVLEHIENDKLAMKELARVLNNQGKAIILVPQKKGETYENSEIVDPLEREKHFGQKDHVRLYGEDFQEKLESVGFKVEPVDFAASLNSTEVEKFCLRSEIIYICSKS